MRNALTAGVRLPGSLRQPEGDAPGAGVVPRIRRGIICRQTVCVHRSSGKRRFPSGGATESVAPQTHRPRHTSPRYTQSRTHQPHLTHVPCWHTSPAGTRPLLAQSLRTHPSQERTKPAFAPHERKNGPHPETCPVCVMEPTLARPCATRLTVWRQLNSWPPQGRSHRPPGVLSACRVCVPRGCRRTGSAAPSPPERPRSSASRRSGSAGSHSGWPDRPHRHRPPHRQWPCTTGS